MQLFTERHADKIRGELSCLDRMIITGTLPGICFADGMTAYLKSQHIRIFDYTKWAEPLREQIRTNAQNLAQKAGLEIQYLRKSHIRKEALVREVVQKRGDHEGLVHIFSAMEACDSYKPWHDKNTGKTFLKTDSGKCLHYYFYFIDKELGLSYMRVPTWAPFRLQFYFNGHNALATALRKRKIDFCMLDNAFAKIADWQTAQTLADDFSVDRLHRVLDRYAKSFCPPIANFAGGYHWSLMQAEYATDIVFKRQQDLAPIYDALVRTAVHAVKAEHVFTFLGRKLTDRNRSRG